MNDFPLPSGIPNRESFFRDLADHLPEAVFVADTKLNLVYLNRRAREMIGLEADGMIDSSTVFTFVTPEQRETAKHNFGRWQAGEVRGPVRYRLMRRDGTTFPVLIHLVPIYDDGAVWGFRGIVVDLTEQEAADNEIRENEQKYRTLFEQNVHGIFYQSADGGLIDVNPQALELLGLTRDQFLGRTSMHPDWKVIREDGSPYPGEEHPSMVALRTGKPVRDTLAGVYNPMRRDFVWININAIPQFRKGDDKPYQAFVTMYDVTWRRQAEAALKESEERYRLTIAATNDGIWDWDCRTAEVAYSQRWQEMLGLSDELADFSNWHERIHPDDVASVRESLEGHLRGETPKWRCEHRLRRADGEWLWVLGRGEVVARDENGAPLRMLGTMTDISARKAAELAQEAERVRAQQYLDVAGVMFVALDRDGCVTLINRRGCDILGYTEDEILGRNWFEVFLAVDDVTAVKSVFNELILDRLENVEYFENPVRCKDGSTRMVAWHNSIVRDSDGQILGLLSSGEDVTDRREAEAARSLLEEQLRQSQKMESIGRLAGGVAHDFNNLLTIINSYAEFAAAELGDDSPVSGDVAQIQDAGEKASALTRQLLAFSRKQLMEPRVVDLNQIIFELEKMLGRLIGEDVALTTELEATSPNVHVDPSQIEQVVMNLVVNARDAMPNGGRLTIRTEAVLVDADNAADHLGVPEGRFVMFSVADTGEGMDADVREHIFEPFFTTREKGRGTGLGLATVYGIVTQSGGIIAVDSAPGEGSTFRVYLPEAEEKGRDTKPPSKAESCHGTETILVVEDEEAVRWLIRRILEPEGYNLITAASGEDAIEIFRRSSGHIHLLLTDVIMPGINGWELAQRLRNPCPDIKVLYMSGYSDDIIADHGVLDHDTSFIAKPFSKMALLSKVRQVLDDETEQP